MSEIAEQHRAVGKSQERTTTICWPALGAILVWTCVGPLAKWALDEFPSIAYGTLQPMIAFVVILGFHAVRKLPVRVERSDLRLVFVAGTLGMGASQLLYIVGLARTSVSHAVILSTCSPLMVAAYRLLIKRQKLDTRSLLGVIGGFLGVVILVSAAGGSSGATMLGDIIIFSGAVAWMAATMLPGPLLHKYGAMRTMVWLLGGASIGLLPIGLHSIVTTVRNSPSLLAWSSLVYGAVFGIVVGTTLWQRAIKEIGPSRTLIYLYLEPVGVMILAALFLDERLTMMQAIGGAFALAGVVLVKKV